MPRTVIAIALQQPDDARGRPESITSDKDKYLKIFDEAFNRDLYVTCVLLDRQVTGYLSKQDTLGRDEKRDVRYYLGMMTASNLAQTAHPSVDKLATLVPQCIPPIDESILDSECEMVVKEYRALVEQLRQQRVANPNDKVGKGTALRAALLDNLDARYPSGEHGHEKRTAA